MNRRFLLAVAASALFGLLAILIFKAILEKQVAIGRAQTPNQIVLTTAKIPPGTVVAQNQVKLAPYPTVAPEGSFTNLTDVVGKVAQIELDANVPIQAKQISAADRQGPGNRLKEGYRAMAIRVDEASSVAGFAAPGSTVDVVAVVTPGANSRPVAKVIVQNLRVLANGQQTQARTEGQGRIGNTVTLEVTPAQAEILTLAGREGTLQLLLRHPADSEIVFVPPVVMPSFVDSYPDSRPTPSVTPTRSNFPPLPTPSLAPTPTPSPVVKMASVRVISSGKVENVAVRQ
jgi:pilus assembly protein CpaB